MTTTTAKCNCISKPNCTLNDESLTQYLVYKGIHLQQPTTASFTMELLKRSSKHEIITIKSLSDTMNA